MSHALREREIRDTTVRKRVIDKREPVIANTRTSRVYTREDAKALNTFQGADLDISWGATESFDLRPDSLAVKDKRRCLKDPDAVYDYYVGSPYGISATDSAEVAKDKLADKNTPEFFNDIHTGKDPNVVAVDYLSERASVAYSAAPGNYGRYTPDLLLFIEYKDKEQQTDSDGKVQPYNLQDLPEEIQIEAIRRELVSFRVYDDYFGHIIRPDVFENISPYVRGYRGKSPGKSIAEPHPHLCGINPKDFTPSSVDWRSEQYKKEQQLIKRHFPDFFERSRRSLEETLKHMGVRLIADEQNARVTFEYPIDKGSLVSPDSARIVQKVRALHAATYDGLTTALCERYGRVYPDIGKHLMDNTMYRNSGIGISGCFTDKFRYGPIDEFAVVEHFLNARLERQEGFPIYFDLSESPNLLRPIAYETNQIIGGAQVVYH